MGREREKIKEDRDRVRDGEIDRERKSLFNTEIERETE